MPDKLEIIRERFVEFTGRMSQSLGAGRAIGQVFAFVYFSKDPQTLDNLTHSLGISKGSASMCVRQLEQWGALRRVWVRGDRKDYYEASTEFGNIIRKLMVDSVGRAVEDSERLLGEAEALLHSDTRDKGKDSAEWEFMRKRVGRLRWFRDRVRKTWESRVVSMLLKK